MSKKRRPAPVVQEPSHPWLSHAELADLAARRTDIERDPFGYTLRDDERRTLDRLLYRADCIGVREAELLRIRCGLAPLDAERAHVAAVLDVLPLGTASTVEEWAPFAGLGLPMTLGVPRRGGADLSWHLSRLDLALGHLRLNGCNFVVQQRIDASPFLNLEMWRGPSITLIFHARQPEQVAA